MSSKIPLRKLLSFLNEKTWDGNRIPESHYLHTAIKEICSSLLDMINEGEGLSNQVVEIRKTVSNRRISCLLARKHLSHFSDLRWVITFDPSGVSIGLETPRNSSVARLICVKCNEKINSVVRILAETRSESAEVEVLIDGQKAEMPEGKPSKSQEVKFGRAPTHSLSFSLIAKESTDHPISDLIPWALDCSSRLKRIYKELRPPVDVTSPGSASNEEMSFPEGAQKFQLHLTRERNSAIAASAKSEYAERHNGSLPCEICGFDFYEHYGDRGHLFAEAHHIVPLSESSENRRTATSDFAIVCSNCHRMLHRNPPVTPEELKLQIRKN